MGSEVVASSCGASGKESEIDDITSSARHCMPTPTLFEATGVVACGAPNPLGEEGVTGATATIGRRLTDGHADDTQFSHYALCLQESSVAAAAPSTTLVPSTSTSVDSPSAVSEGDVMAGFTAHIGLIGSAEDAEDASEAPTPSTSPTPPPTYASIFPPSDLNLCGQDYEFEAPPTNNNQILPGYSAAPRQSRYIIDRRVAQYSATMTGQARARARAEQAQHGVTYEECATRVCARV